MSKFARYELESGGELLFEVDDEVAKGLRPASGTASSNRVVGIVDNVLAPLRSLATRVVQELGNIGGEVLTPEQIELQLGVKLSTTGDLVIAKGTGEGNLNLRISWVPKSYDT